MKNIAYLAFAALGLIWGTTFIFTHWALATISPEQIVFLRVLFGFIPLLAYALLTGALRWRDLRQAHHFLVMSLLATALYYYAYAKGTSLLLTSVAGMLSGAIPLFTFVACYLFLRDEPLNARMTAGVATGFIGVLLIAKPWQAAGIDLTGVLYMALGSLSVGGSFVYAKRFLTRLELSPLALCTYQIGFALVIISAFTDFNGIGRITEDTRAMVGVAVGLGLFGTGIAYILYYLIVQRLGAVVASSATYVPPIIAILIGTLFAHEPFDAGNLVAIVAILGGVYLLQSGRRQTAKATRALASVR